LQAASPAIDGTEGSIYKQPLSMGGLSARHSLVFGGFMANTSSARKAARKIAHRTAVNRNRRSQVKTFVRKVEEAIASGDRNAAAAALKAAQPIIMRSASKGVMHRNTASRKIARLAARVKKIGG
jgi:small subunit ribosomal protein S20